MNYMQNAPDSVAPPKSVVKLRSGGQPKPRLAPTDEMVNSLPANSKLISLTKGRFAIVDADLFDALNGVNWISDKKGYALCRVTLNGKRKWIRMHRVVLQTPEGMETDHINCNKLDNRRCNLRVASTSQNQCNRGLGKNNTSGFKGVSFHKSSGKWQANIMIHGNARFLGIYPTPEAAFEARNSASLELHGEFARLS